MSFAPKISVILPTLNAQDTLASCLSALVPACLAGRIKEVILADGGSTDATLAIAEDAGARIVQGPACRGGQMAQGAAMATSEWLLFLHADSVLSPEWLTDAETFMRQAEGRELAAAFHLRFDDASRQARRVEFWVDLRSRRLGLPYGDQGLLISRDLYARLGGHPKLELMEDVALVRRIGRRNMRILPADITTSAIKYRRDGWRKRTWRNLFLVIRFYLGEDPGRLAKEYH